MSLVYAQGRGNRRVKGVKSEIFLEVKRGILTPQIFWT